MPNINKPESIIQIAKELAGANAVSGRHFSLALAIHSLRKGPPGTVNKEAQAHFRDFYKMLEANLPKGSLTA